MTEPPSGSDETSEPKEVGGSGGQPGGGGVAAPGVSRGPWSLVLGVFLCIVAWYVPGAVCLGLFQTAGLQQTMLYVTAPIDCVGMALLPAIIIPLTWLALAKFWSRWLGAVPLAVLALSLAYWGLAGWVLNSL